MPGNQSTTRRESQFPGKSEDGWANERTILDPITHSQLVIHDITEFELERVPPPPSALEERPRADIINQGEKEATNSSRHHASIEQDVHGTTHDRWWHDSGTNSDRARVQTAIVASIAAGIGATGGLTLWWLVGCFFCRSEHFLWVDVLILPLGCCLLALLVGTWVLSYTPFQHHPDQPPPYQGKHPRPTIHHPSVPLSTPLPAPPQVPHTITDHSEHGPESAIWLNSFLRSIWPIINPAILDVLSGTFEDSLQSSLPKLIRGARIADIRQGTEPLRILAIRWLSSGEADRDVQGTKAEDDAGFINMEVTLAYRAKPATSTASLKDRSANFHSLVEFYVASGMVLPVWVELTGFLTMARLGFQLMPNPPFLAAMKLTLLGQPKIVFKCTPLAKNTVNLMEVPGLSGWVNDVIHQVVGQYVAPKSINLDLKSLLMGAPRVDVAALGVVIVTVRCTMGFTGADKIKVFKPGEDGRKGGTYVTLRWNRWGKSLWATRIISGKGNPIWEETTALLVNQEVVDAEESLQVQVWDVGRLSSDDLIGTIDLPLSYLMNDPETHNRISIRQDQIRTEGGQEPVPGQLLWECGYFPKTTVEQHLEHKHRGYDEIKAEIEAEAESRLREAEAKELLREQPEQGSSSYEMQGQVVTDGVDGRSGEESRARLGDEVEGEKKEDRTESEPITSSKPTAEFPSGILSVRIDKISELGVRRVREAGVKEADEGEDDDADDLPSAYCTVFINHRRVYKTRTKMKCSNPFFDASTEKFVRNWQDTTVIIAVRDNRMHENSPILGVIVLPLSDVFRDCSAYTHAEPIIGGIGFGRVTFSLIFRSVQVQLPRRLLGWDVGTLEIRSKVYAVGSNALVGASGVPEEGSLPVGSEFPSDLANCRLLFKTRYGKGKMMPFHPTHYRSHTRSQSDPTSGPPLLPVDSISMVSSSTAISEAVEAEAEWRQKKGKPIRLPVVKRYASCLHVQFRKRALGPDWTLADCMLWLKDIPDEDEVTVQLPIRRQHAGGGGGGGGGGGVGGGSSKLLKCAKNASANAHTSERSDMVGDLEEGIADGGASLYKGEVVPDAMLVMRLRFWHGLSGYHQGLANRNEDLRDMMEVLDCVEEQNDIGPEEVHNEREENEESEGEESDDTFTSIVSGKKYLRLHARGDHTDGEEDAKGKRKFVEEAKAQRTPTELYKKHRGLMQWKRLRNVIWAGHSVERKAEKLGRKIKNGFQHQDGEAVLENEV